MPRHHPLAFLRRAAWRFAGIALLPLCGVAQTVLLLSTGSTTLDTQTRSLLQDAGYSVTLGSPYTTFAPAELTGIDVVLLLPNANWNAGDMPLASQTALASFVQNGGGLVTSEWTNWKVGNGGFALLSPLLPGTATSQYTSASTLLYTRLIGDATLDAGLPTSFGFATDDYDGVESQFAAKTGATIYFTSLGGGSILGVGVVGWTSGSGRVLQFSTTGGANEFADANYSRLFTNSVAWTAQSVPEPSVLALLGAGGLLLAWRRRRA